MKAAVVTIGYEIISGHIADTNSQWICSELNALGVEISCVVSIDDKDEYIHDTVSRLFLDNSLVIITGGLGPTNDDKTKRVLCRFFDANLILDNEVLRHISDLFRVKGYVLTKLNQDQALIPDKAKVLFNKQGTAPGMWFESEGHILISLPGVPFEMKQIMKDSVLPKLKKMLGNVKIIHKVIGTQGIAESFLADKINDWERALPNNMKLAYLPSPGIVKLRISAVVKQSACLDEREVFLDVVNKLKKIIGEYIYTEDGVDLAVAVGESLLMHHKTIATAESCTGGYIGHLITLISGSSEYFKGGVIAYSNEIKEKILGVSGLVLAQKGAVSEEVVSEMIDGLIDLYQTDIAVAVSGIAGPLGGSEDKPVGTVYIAVGNKERKIVKRFHFGNDRERNIQKTAITALKMVYDILNRA